MIEKCRVGYFQFENKSDGLYVNVYPPKEETFSPAKIDDAMFYIDKKKISCDIVKLDEAIKTGASKEVCQKISEECPNPVGEFADYYINPDGMSVEAIFYPPFVGASFLDLEEIKKDITFKGVRSGTDEAAINDFLENKEYGKVYVLAKGKEPRQGTDGYIEYKFNTDLKPRPKINEDGTVDFHSLENLNHIEKGDVVAILHPEDRGEEGIDCLNRKVNPRPVKHVVFRYGRNLVISEDGLNLISKVSGHVMLEGDKIFVSDVLELVDVGPQTGDIDYDGNVLIKGNVQAGFKIKASGDISVSGLVEGAEVIAGGTITLNRGVQGKTKAVIKAGKNIVAKFLESCESVYAGGDIEADSILHSKVIAKGKVTANGKNGLIIGGDVRATLCIEAKNIGNEMGTNTTVAVGVDPTMKRRLEELKKILNDLGKNKIQLNQLLEALRKKQQAEGSLAPEKQEMMTKTMRNVIMLEQEIAKNKKEFEELRQSIGEEQNAIIRVADAAYPGTKIVFGDVSMFVKKKYDFCSFVRDGAEVRLSAY
ncbi:MAG: FapA family protein [Lachnospira sp.]|uniref:Flagellar Assembly Protein A N-terminal region domain-containing protein n=1 Tax=Lachnospira pectinoschiza TaxID=28052 RepID=A0A1G9Z9V3_9FIRM|nr:FapA family protein [Lachnospira pectinoschiza]MCR5514944.1 FapA family protein [Lachnospira sp.]SDN18288.1 hypothetical protein SAMN05216544_2101 [Lachnospira pectinoschiza]